MSKKVTLQMLLAGKLEDLQFKTGAENVIITNEDGTTEKLSDRLVDVAEALNSVITEEEVENIAAAAVAQLLVDAPEAFDTFKEIADYLSNNEDVINALNTAIHNKVDKVEGKGLSTHDFTDEYKAKLDNLAENSTHVEASETNGNILVNGEELQVYVHPDEDGWKHLPAEGQAGQTLVANDDGTASWADSTAIVNYGAVAPDVATLREGEIFFLIEEDGSV